MENILRALFDLQKFEQNSDLRSIVDAVHARYKVRRLSDEESALVSAAGMPGADLNKKDPWDGKDDLP